VKETETGSRTTAMSLLMVFSLYPLWRML